MATELPPNSYKVSLLTAQPLNDALNICCCLRIASVSGNQAGLAELINKLVADNERVRKLVYLMHRYHIWGFYDAIEKVSAVSKRPCLCSTVKDVQYRG